MCVAVPGRVLAVEEDGTGATVTFGVSQRRVDVTMTPDVQPGDWVIAHSGFAVRVVSAEHAAETLRLLAAADPSGASLPGNLPDRTD